MLDWVLVTMALIRKLIWDLDVYCALPIISCASHSHNAALLYELTHYFLGLQWGLRMCQSIQPYLRPYWRVERGHLMTSKSWPDSIFSESSGKWKR